MHVYCYVAAPFEDAAQVRQVHAQLEALGITPTSRWAYDAADGPEDLVSLSPEARRDIIDRNDADLRGSHIVLVLARKGAGAETYAEARVALEWGKSVVWVGHRSLSSYRPGVVRVDTLREALERIAAMREPCIDGMRGALLALLAAEAS